MIPWQPIALALANRARDGWIKIPEGQLGRMLWAVPFAVTVFLTAVPEWIWYYQAAYLLTLTLAAFGGACLAAWGRFNVAPIQWLPLACEGMIFVAPVALIAVIHSFLLGGLILLSGATISPSYYAGWKISGAWHGTAYGSLLFGACIGAFLFLSQG